jgi:hypothetical protein
MKTWVFIGLASILLALASARFPDFFIVTFATIGFAFCVFAAWVLWAVHRDFGRWK